MVSLPTKFNCQHSWHHPAKVRPWRPVIRVPSLVVFFISVSAVGASLLELRLFPSCSMEGLENLPDYLTGYLRWRWWLQSQECLGSRRVGFIYGNCRRKKAVIVFTNGWEWLKTEVTTEENKEPEANHINPDQSCVHLVLLVGAYFLLMGKGFLSFFIHSNWTNMYSRGKYIMKNK